MTGLAVLLKKGKNVFIEGGVLRKKQEDQECHKGNVIKISILHQAAQKSGRILVDVDPLAAAAVATGFA